MISPTGNGIRADSYGQGHYGASRGTRKHLGTDYLITNPGVDIVVAPISGMVIRECYPYADKSYSGLIIDGQHIRVKLFYFKPTVISGWVMQGDEIGISQNISLKYPTPPGKPWMKMLPHVHLEIESVDPQIFVSML